MPNLTHRVAAGDSSDGAMRNMESGYIFEAHAMRTIIGEMPVGLTL